MAPLIVSWIDPPAMDAGAPMPAISCDKHSLICAYVIGLQHPQSGLTAVLRFDHAVFHSFGYPNDEALAAHPLYDLGLQPYAFQVIEHSPLLDELDRKNQVHPRHVPGSMSARFKHWVLTFHDSTLDVVAMNASVCGVTADSPSEAASRLFRKADSG